MYINIHLYSPFTLLKALLIVQTLLWTCGEDFAVKHPNFWWRDRLCLNCKCLSIYLEWYLIRFRSVNTPSLNILWTFILMLMSKLENSSKNLWELTRGHTEISDISIFWQIPMSNTFPTKPFMPFFYHAEQTTDCLLNWQNDRMLQKVCLMFLEKETTKSFLFIHQIWFSLNYESLKYQTHKTHKIYFMAIC